MKCDGALVVPLRNPEGRITSLEFIAPDGEKRFLPRGVKAGCYFSIGKPEGVLYIAEGFATAASVHEATGQAVAVAFDAGNLTAVVLALRGKLPDARIVIAGDHDEGGTGQRAAIEAARAAGGYVAIPEGQGNDWNDVARRDGLEAVRGGLQAAQSPEAIESKPGHQNAPQTATSSQATHDEWPEPARLPDNLPAVEPFLLELLPVDPPWIGTSPIGCSARPTSRRSAQWLPLPLFLGASLRYAPRLRTTGRK